MARKTNQGNHSLKHISFSKQRKCCLSSSQTGLESHLPAYPPFTAGTPCGLMILPGLQSINTTIPLGGTVTISAASSSSFKTRSFNLHRGLRLGRAFCRGYKTAIIDSTTWKTGIRCETGSASDPGGSGVYQTYRPCRCVILHYFPINMGGTQIFAYCRRPHIFHVDQSILWWSPSRTSRSIGSSARRSDHSIPAVHGRHLTDVETFYLYNYMIGCAKCGHWDLIKTILSFRFTGS